MDQPAGIYQPIYKPALRDRLDRGFIALDWMSNPFPAMRELALHRHIGSQEIFRKHGLTGLLSPKFYSKTGLTSAQVYDWIAENRGYEIYLISGVPYRPYTVHHAIEHNEILHGPSFLKRMRMLCDAIGFDLPEHFPRQTNKNLCICNYWVASAGFWERWLKDVVNPIFALFDRRQQRDELFEYRNHAGQTPVYQMAFMYERMMDYYVARHRIKALYYPWSPERVLALEYDPSVRRYLEEMIPGIERIDARGEWTAEERLWVRDRYAALGLPFGSSETLTADPLDFDLPRRYPGQAPRG